MDNAKRPTRRMRERRELKRQISGPTRHGEFVLLLSEELSSEVLGRVVRQIELHKSFFDDDEHQRRS